MMNSPVITMKSPMYNNDKHPRTGQYWRTVKTIIWKDLSIEMRKKTLISALFIFCVMVTLVFTFALDLDKSTKDNVSVGVLWVTFVFSSTLGLNQTFANEKKHGSLEGMLLAPIDHTAIFVGKFISTYIFVIIIEIIIIPMFYILYGISLFSPLFLLIVLLGSFGYTLVGTLLTSIAIRTQVREIMLPILLFPVSMPIIIASVQCSNAILSGANWGQFSNAFNLVIVYDIIFIGVAIMTFEYLIQE
ncbi:MAG: cytochrome C biogenesis protein [Chloroflexi bacterium]|nr:cytochrome C biogenesis protein [Chloroflexota bacterium]HCU80288.1 cytochrome C biogenesis protein [Chloroflexota bacterium]